ncbi:MAG TPA: hypothetical protein VLC51_07315 [Nitrospira sp.]|nr:hypothetical protein [Nitrospira sp.]
MSADPVVTALQTSGHLQFSENIPFKENLDHAGGRVVRRPTGHLVFYRSDGRRFLATDPAGNPLHECEWGIDPKGGVALIRARIKLDWGAWVGLKPSGLVNETSLNLATKPGWQRLKADDLRAMAAQALRVPLDEVRWFYRDEDFSISPSGMATIRHRKDALYVLDDGDFERARFMSCMGAMHWGLIDFLPVVELFKSLLPGTGSAVFELIRGLYDDQNEGKTSSLPLRYRGIPTYPSEAAFRLFSSFFIPRAPHAKDILSLFMDPAKAHQIEWFPSPTPPRRYFDILAGCCLTVQGGVLKKVTLANDVAGLPYMNPETRGFAPCDRTAQIVNGQVIVKDRDRETVVATPLPQECREEPVLSPSAPVSPIDWRSLFLKGVPPLAPEEAYGAVLLYPQDDTELDELATQPFVADYIEDVAEQDREIGNILARAERVLIENGDAVIATCIVLDRPRDYTVRVQVPAFAQKQAQQLWSVCARLQQWDWLNRIRFVPITRWQQDPSSAHAFDLAYQWIPFAMEDDPLQLLTAMKELRLTLRSGGHAFVLGPASLSACLAPSGFRMIWKEPLEQLPTFRMHRTILPKARLKAGLTLYYVKGS